MAYLIRTFIAIKLDDQTKEHITRIQSKLKESQADVKWVESQNIHLTLKFLGEIPDQSIAKVKTTIDQIATLHNSFSMTLEGIGAFPKLSLPRVIWIGITTGKKEVLDIVSGIEDSLAKSHFKREEKEFSPHITIGRVRSNLNRANLIDRITENTNWQGSIIKIEELTLFKSTLTTKGPIYDIIYGKTLKTN